MARFNIENLIFRTILLATLCFVAGVFAFNQNYDHNKQQNEMNTNPSAHEVSAPKTFSAKLMDDPTAFFTAALAALTLVLAATGAAQIFYLRRADETARKTADAALISANSARSALVMGQRAWVTVEAEVGTDGITFDMGIQVPVRFSFANIGNSIALNVTPYAQVFFQGKYGPRTEAWHKFITDSTKRKGYMSVFLVPEDAAHKSNEPKSLTVLVSTSPFDRIIIESEQTIFIGGCVTYTFPSDPEAVHHTGFFYHLRRADGEPIASKDGQLPASDVVLARHIGSNFFSID